MLWRGSIKSKQTSVCLKVVRDVALTCVLKDLAKLCVILCTEPEKDVEKELLRLFEMLRFTAYL